MEVFCYDNKFLGIHDITDLKIPLHSLTNVQSVVVPSERLIMCDLDHRAQTVSQRVSLNLSF